MVSPLESFDVKTCRRKLADHYKRTATVPTSVWSKKSPVKIHQIYTRLSWVKEEQTPAGSSRSELGHYTDVLTASKEGVVPKRILVQGQTGIGKSTFVKKLAVDWAELDDEKMEAKQRRLKDEENSSEYNKETSQIEPLSSDDSEDTSSESGVNMSRSQDILKKFEILLVINLKEASKCQNLQDIINRSHIFSEEETALSEGLLSYISKNQEKVLLVFDGYDEYHCGNNSEIYEIFRGNKLRNCGVLITTRISKADDLREFKDVCVEITGFSEEDREAFMSRMLGCKAETRELIALLRWKKLTDLARVPILLLFFCTLWKRGKLKSFPNTKTKLYLEIVQCVLDYSHGKCSPAHFAKVQDYKEILAEIGKVALECLLKGEHVFEYDQLSAAILSEESVIIGLLQVTEYAENQHPAGMVSFFHKSIQEFLAAWYITYKFIPEGTLGGIEDHADTLENCQVLENVFQFVCGLSEDGGHGALRVSAHLRSVRTSDPTLVLSKTAPDVENETDVIRMPCDITDRQKWFSEFVVNSFREVNSIAEFVRHCFDCTGGFVLASKLLCESAPKAKDLTQLTHSGVFIFAKFRIVDLYDWLLFLDCLHLPLRMTEGSACFLVEGFLKRFFPVQCDKGPTHETNFIDSILFFRDGQFKFYITDLELVDDDHARLYTETSTISVPRDFGSLHSEQLCLEFLRSLICFYPLSSKTVKDLGAMIRICKHLNRVEVYESDDSVCYLLEQIPMPSSCSLQIGHPCELPIFKCALTSAGAEALAHLLPRFNNITCLYLGLSGCCAAAVDKLVPSIAHKTLEELELNEILLTPIAAEALSQTLPKMLSLRRLSLRGKHGLSSLQATDMDALFGRLNEPLPVEEFLFHCFSVRGCLAPLTKSLRFFPNLRKLSLLGLNMDEHDLSGLQENFRFIPNLDTLELSDNPFGQGCPATKILQAMDNQSRKCTWSFRVDVLRAFRYIK